LHTCWSIVFECLNSNSYLNSFDWVVFQIENLSLLSFSFLPISGLLCFEPRSPKPGRAPSVPQPGSPSHLGLCGPLRLWPASLESDRGRDPNPSRSCARPWPHDLRTEAPSSAYLRAANATPRHPSPQTLAPLSRRRRC
jgi:hypothetical protein